MSALCVMNAMMRIWPPQIGHSSGNTSQMHAISTERDPVYVDATRCEERYPRTAGSLACDEPQPAGGG